MVPGRWASLGLLRVSGSVGSPRASGPQDLSMMAGSPGRNGVGVPERPVQVPRKFILAEAIQNAVLGHSALRAISTQNSMSLARVRSGLFCLPDCTSHFGAADTQRLLAIDCRIAHRLMFDLGIQLCTQQNNDRGNPHPHHDSDGRAERAIRFVVIGEAREIPGQQQRNDEPSDRSENTSEADPLPAGLAAARAVALEDRQPGNDQNKQDWPPGKP